MRVDITSQRENPAVDQVAGCQSQRLRVDRSRRRRFQTVEKQQRQAPLPRYWRCPQRRLRDQPQLALAADNQTSQVEISVVQHVVKMIATAIYQGLGFPLLNQRLLALDQFRQTPNEIAATRIGVAVWI